MRYNQFIKQIQDSIYPVPVVTEAFIYGNRIALLEDGSVFINYSKSASSSMEEAIDYIKTEQFKEELRVESIYSIPESTIADIIRKHDFDVKITNSLIESYVQMAIDQELTTDPVVLKIRSFYPSNTIENKIDFVLEDGSTIAISSSLLEKINLNFKSDKYINSMRKSIENFTHAIKDLI